MNKKGLTLVELLTIIVILTIIFLIAIPFAEKAIAKARKASYKTSANNYVEAVEKRIIDFYSNGTKIIKNKAMASGEYRIDKKTLTYNNHSLMASDPIIFDIDAKGDMPSEGKVCVNNDGKVVRYSLKFGKYVVTKISKSKGQTIEKAENPENIICEYSDDDLTINAYGPSTVCSNQTSWSEYKTVEMKSNLKDPDGNNIQIQYSINSAKGPWINYSSPFIVRENCTIYGRLFDGTVYSSIKTYTIMTIDTTYPKINVKEACSRDSKIIHHLEVKYGISGGTVTCTPENITESGTFSCKATSGACLSTTYNGNAIANPATEDAVVSKNDTEKATYPKTYYPINEIKKINLYVAANGKSAGLHGGQGVGEACKKYGSASVTIYLYGVDKNGNETLLDSVASGKSDKDTTKTAEHDYVIKDSDRTKYKSIYSSYTASSNKASCCNTGGGDGYCYGKWGWQVSPVTTAKATIYNFETYCIQ